MDPLNFGAGVFPDVAFSPTGTPVIAYRVPNYSILVHWIPGHTFSIDPGMADNTFCRLWTWQGIVWLAYRALRAEVPQACVRMVWPDGLGPETTLGRCSGNSPVCLGPGRIAWQNDLDNVVRGLTLSTGEQVVLRAETRPTGLSRLVGERVVFIDEDRNLVAGMSNPVWAGACVVGEGDDWLAVSFAEGPAGALMRGECMVPRVATDGAGHYAAVTWGAPGIRFLRFTADDVSALAPVAVPRIGRALWCGFFDFAERTPIGNCWLPVTQNASWLTLQTPSGQPIARYVAGKPDGDLKALEWAIENAALDWAMPSARPSAMWPLPIIAFWTHGMQTGRLPAGADWIGVQAYRLLDELLEIFENRVRAAVARCEQAVLIAQAYTSNAALSADLRDLPAIYARIARESPQVVGILAFSGSGRQTGLVDHPEIRQPWEDLAAGIPSAPPIVVMEPEPDPVPEPDPIPHPTPIPIPEEPDPMIAYAAPIAGFLPGELVPHPDGDGVAIQKPNAKFLCVTPEGKVEERDAAGGWEKFRQGKSSLIAERDGGRIYVLPFASAE